MSCDCIVIGGGAAGLFCAVQLARQGKSAMDPAFADAVREAGEILAAEDEQAVFLDMLEEEQSELKELRNRLI